MVMRVSSNRTMDMAIAFVGIPPLGHSMGPEARMPALLHTVIVLDGVIVAEFI